MKEETLDELSLEPERYELYQEPAQRWEMARREFFGLLGAGVVVLFALDEVPGAPQEQSG